MKYFNSIKYILTFLFVTLALTLHTKAALTGITLTPGSVAENEPIGSIVGTLVTLEDGTTEVEGTYSFAGGAGSDDNSSFSIVGDQLLTAETFNFEVDNSYSIRIHSQVGFESFEQVLIVSITNVAEVPSLSGVPGSPLTYIEGQSAIIVASAIQAIDDDDLLSSARVFFNSVNDEDSLYTAGSPIPANYDQTTNELTFSTPGTVAQYTSALRSIRYYNMNTTDPSTADRYINFEISDGTTTSAPVTRLIQIETTNTAPVLSGISATVLSYTEGSAGLILASNINITDDESVLDSAQIYFSSGYENGQDSLYYPGSIVTSKFRPNSGILSLTGSATLTQYRDALRTVRYINTSDAPVTSPNRIVSFRVHDGEYFSNVVSRTFSVSGVNDPPVASEAVIEGTFNPFRTRELLTADYVYTDAEGNEEGSSTFSWYTATSVAGAGRTVISGAVSDTFTTRFTDGGKWISMIVTPREQSGLWGDDDTSTWYYINAAPRLQAFTIKNEKHPGAYAVGETVKAEFTYSDLESNPAGTHEFQWYWNTSNTWTAAHLISDATRDSFLITNTQNNRYIGLQAIPHAISGSPNGEITRSPMFLVGTTPTAVISGLDSICGSSDVGKLIVTLTGSNTSWDYRYVLTGTTDTITVSNVTLSPDTLEVSDDGTYILVNVSDEDYDFGTVSGTGRIVYRTLPTANLTEDEVGICPGDAGSYSIPVTLTGDAPFRISVQELNHDSTTYNSIPGNTYQIPITLADTGSYSLLHVWDEHCMAEGTGTTLVVKETAPVGIMSGDTTICQGGTAVLSVDLSGDGPWTFYYRRNTGSEVPVTVNQNLAEYTYNMSVTAIGTYTLTRVVDQDGEGCASGSAIVQNRIAPTAQFTEGSSACESAEHKLNVNLLGESPWTVTYRYESQSPVTVTNLSTNPSAIPAAQPGTYTLISMSDKYCSGTASGTIEVIPAPEVSVGGFTDTLFSFTQTSVPFTVEPLGGNFESSSNPDAIIYSNGTWNFSPYYAYVTYGSPFKVVYSYTNPSTTCVGKDSVKLYILQFSAEINIESERKERYCSNDGLIELKGVNIKGNVGNFSISSPGTGLINAGNNVAYLDPQIIKSGSRTVTYTVEIDGDDFIAQKLFNFNHINADFSWDNECFDEQSLVNFTDNSTSTPDTLTGYQWNFYIGEDTVTSYEPLSASHTFANLGTYSIELITSSFFEADSSYCYDTIKKDLILKPTFNITSTPVLEDFQDNQSQWYSFPIGQSERNTWTYGTPEGSVFSPPSTEKSWYTMVENLDFAESSYVISPCYDFSNSKRPMIKMDIWRGFNTNGLHRDGAVLQYTVDNGATWNAIGSVGDGIRWYNSFNITGLPGQQSLGWDETHDQNWVEVRHKLDELKGFNNVRFRIAYGAAQQYGVTSNGIAFDDFWIGERTKNVLLEHFTNAGDEASREADEALNIMMNNIQNSADIIDLQYHFDSPGYDTFNIINPYPTHARDLYYGVPSIPYSIIDGGRGNQGMYMIDYSTNESLVQNDLTQASLVDNQFTFNIQTNKTGGGFDIDIRVKSNVAFEEKSLTLHTIIIENVITGITGDNGETNFESVVKDMLPNTGGTSYYREWAVGAVEELSLHYNYANVFNELELRVVVFIQDDETGEIYQAELLNPNAPVVGLNPTIENQPSFIIFPNPARDLAYIKILQSQTSELQLQIISFNGRLISSKSVMANEDLIELRTSSYLPGIYMVRILQEGRLMGSKKLLITGNK